MFVYTSNICYNILLYDDIYQFKKITWVKFRTQYLTKTHQPKTITYK